MYGMAMNDSYSNLRDGNRKTHTAIQIYLPMAQLNPSPTKVRQKSLSRTGAAVASPKELESKLALNGNLMDFLTDDARRVEKQLSGDDKERFASTWVLSTLCVKLRRKKRDSRKRCESTHPRYLTATTRQLPQFESSHTLRLLPLL